MRHPLMRASFLTTTLALLGCSSSDEPTCKCIGPAPLLETRVGDELEADRGVLTFTVNVVRPNDVFVSIDVNVASDSPRESLQVGFGEPLSAEDAKQLVAGETVMLDGTSALAWGDQNGTVSRPIEQMSLERDGEDQGVVTLTLGLGAQLFSMEGADVERFGAAREASFTGPIGISCVAPGDDQQTVGDPTFSTEWCKQAADEMGLWPLLSLEL